MRRSASDWAVRGVLAVIVAALGYLSVTHAVAYTLRSSAPASARALAPDDGRINALAAQRLAGAEASNADRARADRLASLALRQDATAVAAVSTLGVNAQIRGDSVVARRLFSYAERLSRRELQTQIWAIEDAVGRGDIAQALRHYDIALRTSLAASELLFPILGTAMADPAIRTALVRTLSGQPMWRDAFINYAARNSPDPRVTATLFVDLRRAGVPIGAEAQLTIVDTLITGGFAGEAWSYYTSIHQGADRRVSRDPRFSANLATPSQFDWVAINSGGIATSTQGIFDFSVPASVGGPMLQQLQLLTPGEYLLEGHSIGIDQSTEERPYWTLICEDGRELGRIAMLNSADANGRFAGRFTVPARECQAQTLVLIARPSEAASGQSGQIDQVRLRPVPTVGKEQGVAS
jgi:hypothetical protein